MPYIEISIYYTIDIHGIYRDLHIYHGKALESAEMQWKPQKSCQYRKKIVKKTLNESQKNVKLS